MDRYSTIIGDTEKPRFEFRSFGQHFEQAAKKMARLSMPVPEKFWERESDEVYIVSRSNDRNNLKIRDGKLEIKTLLEESEAMEQWAPSLVLPFPVTREELIKEIAPTLGISVTLFEAPVYSEAGFIAFIDTLVDVQAVRVNKRRSGFLVYDTICETGEVLVNGAKIFTISSESANVVEIIKVLEATGLDKVENISYPEAVRRVIGMVHKPLAN
jgi:hypothetical protein